MRASPWALAVLILLIYAQSLFGGFLNYDDPWLLQSNRILLDGDWGAMWRVWFALDDATRMSLGAEYLPLRDSLHWFEARLFNLNPHLLRGVNLGIFLAGILILRLYLIRAFPKAIVLAESASWLFALHPVHVESVAWLAGRKDVMALLFVSLALLLYAKSDRRWVWLVPICAVAGMFSKGVAVILPALLLLHDFLLSRRPKWILLGLTAAFIVLILSLQIHVGRVVGMVAPWHGGSRWTTIATMGPVWLRYLGNSLAPTGLSLVYEQPIEHVSSFGAWLGWAVLVLWASAGIWKWRFKEQKLALWSFGVFAVGLGPTSQIFVPLQNLMADRYLLFAVLGPIVLATSVVSLLPLRSSMRAGFAGSVLLTLCELSASRAKLFSDSVLLWTDTLEKTKVNPLPSYELALALEMHGSLNEAELAYRQTLARSAPGELEGRKAANGLAVLLVKQGRSEQAEQLLRAEIPRFPDDPKLRGNLAELVARQGRMEEARELFLELVQRFPSYEPGRRNFEKHFGAL
jgi:protein O-mannosyl-transferase